MIIGVLPPRGPRDEPLDPHILPMFALMARFIGGADYHEPSAADARSRIVTFFDRHLRQVG